jgi:16S rRNA (adenine1518-N6/adenine1519-N6)-dimethyltransferase
MNKSELIAVLEEKNIRPGRKFGQNFMIDNNLLEYIARNADIREGDCILEIGPGCGALTRKLLKYRPKLAAIEIDKRIVEYLRENLHSPDLTLIQGDACRLDFFSTVQNLKCPEERRRNWKCVANLPYSASTPFTARILECPLPPAGMLFILQKETGLRFAAAPGTKNYGALSVRVQAVFDVQLLRSIPPDVFFPAPDVESALVRFTRKKEYPSPEKIRLLTETVKTAFSQRRKKLINTFAPVYGREKSLKVLASLGISADVRPEELSPSDFLKTTEKLYADYRI